MTDRDELIKAGFRMYQKNEMTNPIYWKTEKERTMVYSTTDTGKLVREYDGLTKYLKDKIEEWEKDD